jgi:hypothetical protein
MRLFTATSEVWLQCNHGLEIPELQRMTILFHLHHPTRYVGGLHLPPPKSDLSKCPNICSLLVPHLNNENWGYQNNIIVAYVSDAPSQDQVSRSAFEPRRQQRKQEFCRHSRVEIPSAVLCLTYRRIRSQARDAYRMHNPEWEVVDVSKRAGKKSINNLAVQEMEMLKSLKTQERT